jgi:hypothetical protein
MKHYKNPLWFLRDRNSFLPVPSLNLDPNRIRAKMTDFDFHESLQRQKPTQSKALGADLFRMVHPIPVPRGTRTPSSRPKSPHRLIPSLEITPPLSAFKILQGVSGVQTPRESESSPAGPLCGGMEGEDAPTGPIGKSMSFLSHKGLKREGDFSKKIPCMDRQRLQNRQGRILNGFCRRFNSDFSMVS